MTFDPSLLSSYPKEPGVYLMKDKEGQILYIGKAKNLRTRLRQYFSEQDQRPQIAFLLPKVHAIDTIVVMNEKEALLLENSLIKQHKPKYNLLLKDDKSFIRLMISDHPWPMIRLIRIKKKKPTDKSHYFGPYTNAKTARQILDLILQLFPLRQCSDEEFRKRARPCLLYEIHHCIAPCVGKCTHDEYQSLLSLAMDLLKGKNKEVVATLKKEMTLAAKKLHFEKAAALREKIHEIEHATKIQHIDNVAAKDCDALSIFREGNSLLVAKLSFREGKLISSEHFSFTSTIEEDEELLESFLLQHYRIFPPPQEILLPFPLPRKVFLEEILNESVKKVVHLLAPIKGNKKALVDIAYKNAKALFQREKETASLREKLLLKLQEELKLTHFPRKIECFDTSHLFGAAPVAALATFVNGKKEKSHTRLFLIKKSKGDDYAAMEEVLLRHLSKAKELPDLLIIDGGKTHLHLAEKVLKALNIASVDLIGLAKEKARHDKGLTQEKIFLQYQKQPLLLAKNSPLLFFLQQIRDEAHRLAISFHRRRFQKTLLPSKK